MYTRKDIETETNKSLDNISKQAGMATAFGDDHALLWVTAFGISSIVKMLGIICIVLIDIRDKK